MSRRRPPAGGFDEVPRTADLDRVLAIERRPRVEEGTPEAEELVDTVTRWYARPDALRPHDCRREHGRACITRLKLPQAWSLFELQQCRGLMGFVGMGFGKTLLAILAPLALDGCRLALLLAPTQLMSQLAKMYRHAAEHWRVPSIRIYGKDAWTCEAPPVNGRPAPRLAVMPYSMLSSADSSTFIENLRPDLIMGDECQNLSDPMAARTRRLLRYARDADAAGRDVRYGFWSGTPTGDSIMDYHHLIVLALREFAPVPLAPDDAEVWASGIDPSPFAAPAGALRELCRDGEHVQEGYCRRLVETPGVITTVGGSSDVVVNVIERRPEIPKEIADTIKKVRDTWVRPDGMKEFEDKIEQWACLHQLACGFFLRWRFPRGEPDELIDRWVVRQKDWNREVRDQLKLNRPKMDSPLLCKRAAQRALAGLDDTPDAPAWDSQTYAPWSEVEGKVRPVTEAVWLSDFVIEDLAGWLAEEPSIAWYESVDFGARLAQVSGAIHHPGGVGAGDRIDATPRGRSIVASIRSHGTGRDGLQYKFRRFAFPQPFASAVGYEQAFARLARPGQEAETVDAVLYGHTPELRDAVAKARQRALYMQRTTLSRQRLIAGD